MRRNRNVQQTKNVVRNPLIKKITANAAAGRGTAGKPRCLAVCIILALLLVPSVLGADTVVRRFGVFIGSNNGGTGRTMLRYAVSDARTVSRVFAEMGGIGGGDNVLLVEPTVREIQGEITRLANRVNQVKNQYRRTEIVFYYSGHSDENGLLLNRDRYTYRELREAINGIPSDIRIVILDSCSSGAITRAKGGIKTQPFLIDDSVSAEGYAFLSSSSADEVSQESDSIASSYFTHSLVAGLRGAADSIGDGRVTLNEVYRFAYSETMSKTELSRYGTQHPSYDMQISGTGDVVLTDIREMSSSMLIDAELSGRISIRDSSDYLIAEITKTAGKAMELGLSPGLYRIVLQTGNAFYQGEITLASGTTV
ncbi:MAG: caspase family protein, partial [Treponema sp.]|nr:caspase family protein [Treponema sp.]